MEAFVWLMLLAILITGTIGYYTDNENFIGLQFVVMLAMIVGVPVISLLV
jgi:hypothetical protein